MAFKYVNADKNANITNLKETQYRLAKTAEPKIETMLTPIASVAAARANAAKFKCAKA